MSVTLSRLWIQLTSDRRKFGMLCAMCAVGLLLWARIIVISNHPRSAVAEDENKLSALTPGPESERQASSSDRTVRLAVVKNPPRDPFVISDKHFPKSIGDFEQDEEVDKSDHERVEDEGWRRARIRARLEEISDRLTLEMVMSSPPMAVLNSTNYRLGDPVKVPGNEDWAPVLAEVRSRSVVLEFEGEFIEVTMDRPRGGRR